MGAAAVVAASRSTDRLGTALAGSLTIGEVARRSGFSIKALRFYERRGLLPPSGRSAGGFRLYSEADLHRLEFIRQAKALGLDLEQIRELVVTAREQTCSMTRPLLLRALDERLLQTRRQISTLRRLEKQLAQRRRTLARRPPTDHGRGYCSCFHEGTGVTLVRRILPKRSAPSPPASPDRRRGGA
ncbi:MAG: MerR family transcriptional regulator [Candidatus Rokubacteria bacterium]|nr:MerR family transcriptional regulator [Candidatus Rokubacteria bacterium]